MQYVNKPKNHCRFLKCVDYPIDITSQIGSIAGMLH